MLRYHELFSLNRAIINYGGYLIYFIRFLRNPRNQELKKNEELIRKKKSDVCYVCGLGPSLEKVNFGALQGDTIVVNNFFEFANQKALKDFSPTYYLLLDAGYLLSSHIGNFKKAIISYPNTNYILNSRLLLNKNVSLSKKNYYFISVYKGAFSKKRTLNLSKVMPAMGNVINTAICIAMGMGYKKIILLGCDFNSFASQKSIHCYKEDDDVRRISLAFELFNYAFDAYTHYEIKDYSDLNHIEIVNATPGSLIDAYKREQLPELYLLD